MADPAALRENLDCFAHARRWKAYWSSQIAGFLRGDVLEAGAGIGANTRLLRRLAPHGRWCCLEPDPALAPRLRANVSEGDAAAEVVAGDTRCLRPAPAFDTVLYIDVLEHIGDDAGEVARAMALLRPGGHLVVLVPAHPSLYTPYDAAIGHRRRYTLRMLAALRPPGGRMRRLRYLDAAGLLASGANRLLLRQDAPSLRQVRTWDRLMVPCSRWVDPLTGWRLGKSALGVWERTG